MRRGEMAGLRWIGADLVAGHLSVQHTRVLVYERVQVARAKYLLPSGVRLPHLPGTCDQARGHVPIETRGLGAALPSSHVAGRGVTIDTSRRNVSVTSEVRGC
jgi:hypothetical protein